MAALTFYSNFHTDPSSYYHHCFPYFSPEFSYFPPPQLLHNPPAATATADFNYVDDDSSVFCPTTPVLPTPFFDDGFPFIDAYPYFSTPAPVDEFLLPVSSAEYFPCDEFEFHCPKRQRVASEQSFCCGDGRGGGNVGGGEGYFYSPPLPPPPSVSELYSNSWEFGMDNAEMVNDDGGGCLKSKPSSVVTPTSSNNLSAQTIAARERRRKITAKTQELGELVPGGSKMNTAEMLSSAFKYVKFLQAQVAILQLEQETEQEEEEETEGLQQILESTVIQHKLYSEEKCLVPKGFVQNLTKFPEIQSHPSIFDSINQILHNSSS